MISTTKKSNVHLTVEKMIKKKNIEHIRKINPKNINSNQKDKKISKKSKKTVVKDADLNKEKKNRFE